MRESEQTIPLRGDANIVEARQAARLLAEEIGFSRTDVVVIATVVSEVARKMLERTRRGEILLFPYWTPGRKGLRIIARGAGPGASDLTLAAEGGHHTSKGIGVDLNYVRLLMDEFDLIEDVDQGTTITMKKWLREGR